MILKKIPAPHPRVTLVGAGPGDPELITLKGIRALASADVVLYDALASHELLNYVPRQAQLIYVGKRVGQHAFSQDEINQQLVAYARRFGHVVRLKGGDPFVFGRGHEEIAFVTGHGITTEVVPGLTSAIAVPAMQGIPVTLRGLSESFWVLTGTTQAGELSADIALAAQSKATVVILMGTRKLAEIVAEFSFWGRAETPVAIIQNGTLPEERHVLGRVNDILARALEAQIDAPAIIVIGEVAASHAQFQAQVAHVHSAVNAFS